MIFRRIGICAFIIEVAITLAIFNSYVILAVESVKFGAHINTTSECIVLSTSDDGIYNKTCLVSMDYKPLFYLHNRYLQGYFGSMPMTTEHFVNLGMLSFIVLMINVTFASDIEGSRLNEEFKLAQAIAMVLSCTMTLLLSPNAHHILFIPKVLLLIIGVKWIYNVRLL